MTQKPDFTQVINALNGAESVLIFAHQGPDGDAFGSMVAMGLALKSMNKHVDYVVDTNKYFLEELFNESLCFNKLSLSSYDIALVVDSSTPQYTFGNEKFSMCAAKVVIDHHDTNDDYGDVNLVIPSCSACGEIVYMLLSQMNISLTHEMAHAIFVALATDTGNFVFSNTSALTHRIAAELYEMYDDYYITAEFLKLKSRDTVEMLKIGLESCRFLAEGRFAISVLSFDKGYNTAFNVNTDSLMSILRYINGVELAVLIRQTGKNEYKISMRSSSEAIDVGAISHLFGGGGHVKAAGFSFCGELSELVKYFEDFALKI